MPKITIDSKPVEVEQGSTILDAAEKLGIEIPTLCFLKSCKPLTSCMVCLVRVDGADKFVPACAAVAQDGMRVESDSQDIFAARRTALELLLSDHLGDCVGPCHEICPAKMNIPKMIREIAAGEFQNAVKTIKERIALPAVLGRICPAPCEKGCRRAYYDSPVAICLLKRYAADTDLFSGNPFIPECKKSTGRNVAIVGAGPAGLAAAYYLLQYGHTCTLFDEHLQAGGMLRYAVSQERLPRDILDAEIGIIQKLGAQFELKSRIDAAAFEQLRKNFDAVIIAAGPSRTNQIEKFGVPATADGIVVDKNSLQTKVENIFAAGDVIRARKLAVRAAAEGRTAAVSVTQLLTDKPVKGPLKQFNTRIGAPKPEEVEQFMAAISRQERTQVSAESPEGLKSDQAGTEALRCMRCDCAKAEVCRLRYWADRYDAHPRKFADQRQRYIQHRQHPDILYEPGKCIKCGLCIQITENAAEQLGLTFVARGFDVKVAVPFGASIAQGLQKTAAKCAEACPTAALAFKRY
ncbi:MAG: FAD-dependent oxidoreductase [Planctomycetota bacterium]